MRERLREHQAADWNVPRPPHSTVRGAFASGPTTAGSMRAAELHGAWCSTPGHVCVPPPPDSDKDYATRSLLSGLLGPIDNLDSLTLHWFRQFLKTGRAPKRYVQAVYEMFLSPPASAACVKGHHLDNGDANNNNNRLSGASQASADCPTSPPTPQTPGHLDDIAQQLLDEFNQSGENACLRDFLIKVLATRTFSPTSLKTIFDQSHLAAIVGYDQLVSEANAVYEAKLTARNRIPQPAVYSEDHMIYSEDLMNPYEAVFADNLMENKAFGRDNFVVSAPNTPVFHEFNFQSDVSDLAISPPADFETIMQGPIEHPEGPRSVRQLPYKVGSRGIVPANDPILASNIQQQQRQQQRQQQQRQKSGNQGLVAPNFGHQPTRPSSVAPSVEHETGLASPVTQSSNLSEHASTPTMANGDSNEVVVCLLHNPDGTKCGKTCSGTKPFRSMLEHIRRTHPDNYKPNMPATEASFHEMMATEGVVCTVRRGDGTICNYRCTGNKPFKEAQDHIRVEHPDRFHPRLPANAHSFQLMMDNPESIVCPLLTNEKEVCGKRCYGDKRFRSVIEHIRRAHPPNYIHGRQANEESFRLMIDRPTEMSPPEVEGNQNAQTTPNSRDITPQSSRQKSPPRPEVKQATKAKKPRETTTSLDPTSHFFAPPAQQQGATVAPEMLTMGVPTQEYFVSQLPMFNPTAAILAANAIRPFVPQGTFYRQQHSAGFPMAMMAGQSNDPTLGRPLFKTCEADNFSTNHDNFRPEVQFQPPYLLPAPGPYSFQQAEPQGALMGVEHMGQALMGQGQMGPAQMGPAQMGPAQMGPAQMGPAQMGPAQMGPAQMGPAHSGQVHNGVGLGMVTAPAQSMPLQSISSGPAQGIAPTSSLKRKASTSAVGGNGDAQRAQEYQSVKRRATSSSSASYDWQHMGPYGCEQLSWYDTLQSPQPLARARSAGPKTPVQAKFEQLSWYDALQSPQPLARARSAGPKTPVQAKFEQRPPASR